MLRACNRVLKTGGLLAFLVIALADGLSSDETTRALDAGPGHVDAGDGYRALLEAAGFESFKLVDVTDQYLATLTAWIREWDTESTELEPLLGVDEFTERQSRRRKTLETVRDGLLRRYVISAVQP